MNLELRTFTVVGHVVHLSASSITGDRLRLATSLVEVAGHHGSPASRPIIVNFFEDDSVRTSFTAHYGSLTRRSLDDDRAAGVSGTADP